MKAHMQVQKKWWGVVATAVVGALSLVILMVGWLASVEATGYAHPAPVRSQAPTDLPDLVINVEAGSETVLANETISFTVFYTNTSTSLMENVIISSTLSTHQYYSFTYKSFPLIPTTSFTYSGDYANGYTAIWQLGDLSPGEAGWIALTTTLPLEAAPEWEDNKRWPLLGMSAIITTSTPEATAGNPLGEPGDSATVMVVGPVFRLTKTDDPDPVRPGRLLTYTLLLENKDRQDAIPATGIVITENLPNYTIFERAGATAVYSPTAHIVTWYPTRTLNPGESFAVFVTVRLTETIPGCNNKIYNSRHRFLVWAAESMEATIGDKDQTTTVDDVLEKRIETPDPPSDLNGVFPGGFVTYTINVYNPRHDVAVSGIRLTDTLPGEPSPFAFVDMISGPDPVTTTPEVVWDGLSVEAGGVLTLTFRAQVPTQIRIDPNQKTREYKNKLSASAPDLVICDMRDKDTSKAVVTRQIWMDKVVNPNHALSGETVIYTITLQNYGHNTISSIRLTDTLPSTGGGNFHYVRMLEGPYPVAVYTNVVVWDGVSVPGDDITRISFYAQAIGWPLVKYGNSMYAYSPQTTIPARTGRAKVEIDSPFTIDKTVSPGETFVEMEAMGESLPEYTVRVCNIATGTYTISQLEDIFPTGFYGVDGASYENPYVYDLPSPVTLFPGDCWTHIFPVAVTKDIGCGNLPKTYKNTRGNVCIRVTDPVDAWFCNAVDLAPLNVNPHVSIIKEREHKVVMPGETFVYTITLDNTSPAAVHLASVEDDLPGPFEYVEMVAGDDPVQTDPVRWEDLTVPAEDQVVLVFRVHVLESATIGQTYKNDVVASPDVLALVCVEDIDPTASVKVVEEVVEFTKDRDAAEVPVRGVVRYTINLKNLDFKPITGVVITETMPNLLGEYFEYIDFRPGTPAPDEVGEHQVIWRNLTIPPEHTLKLQFDARASIMLGMHNNDLQGWCPRSEEILHKRGSQGEDLTLAPVNVLPGIVLYKTVAPTEVVAGQNVIYTITLANLSDKNLTEVRITDTLPSGFSFCQTVSGPAPDQLRPQVVWPLGTVNKNTVSDIVFQVCVDRKVVSGTYYNSVVGYSPVAQIPGAEDTAPLWVTGLDLEWVYLPVVMRSK